MDLAMGLWQKLHNGHSGDTLSASALANDSEDGLLFDIERHTIDSLNEAFVGGKIGVQIPYP
jgi:hypothetical protein